MAAAMLLFFDSPLKLLTTVLAAKANKIRVDDQHVNELPITSPSRKSKLRA